MTTTFRAQKPDSRLGRRKGSVTRGLLVGAALALLGAGAAFADKPVPPKHKGALDPLMVFDATGKTVGKFGGFTELGGAHGAYVQFTLDGSTFAVALGMDGHLGWTFYDKLTYWATSIVFKTPDCTGTAFAPVRGGTGMRESAIVLGGRASNYGDPVTVWFYPLEGNHASRPGFIYASTYSLGTCTAAPEGRSDLRFAAVSAPPTDISSLFKPPFTVK